jgi:hypothetical protein
MFFHAQPKMAVQKSYFSESVGGSGSKTREVRMPVTGQAIRLASAARAALLEKKAMLLVN